MRAAVVLFLLVAVLAGCASTPTHLVESDVPVPTGMQVRYSTGLKREEGRLAGGWFILWGTITNVEETAKGTTSRFAESGWALVDERVSLHRAALTFTKDTRVAHVDIDARRIDPQSSSATVSVGISDTAVTTPATKG